MNKLVTTIDPPGGWQYGFPKQLPEGVHGDELVKWMVQQGYPQELIDEGMLKYCSFTTFQEEE